MPSSAANAILSTMRERRLGSRGLQELIPRTNAQYVLGLLLLLALLLIVALDARSRGHLQTGDSNNLVRGARFALTCLDDREFVACGHAEGSIQTEVFPYPLLQYLPAGFLVALGWNDADVLLALGTLNLLAFAAALLYAAATFRERPTKAALVLLALTGSSLVYHSTSAFGEGLVAALVVMAVCAAVRRRPVEIFSFVLVGSLGKETLAPFIVALVLICARSLEDGLLPPRRLTVPAISAGASALVVNGAFNVFRFGDVRNLLYLDAPQHTPGLSRKVEFFFAIPGSPSAGVLWFWPFLSALALVGTAIGIRHLLRRPSEPRAYAPVLCVTAVMLLWFGGLSAWYSPFGWIAYGPRLEVPLLGGLAVAYVHTVGESIVRIAQHSRLARVLGYAVVLAGSLQFFAPWRYTDVIGQLILGRASCPDMTGLDVYARPAEFYRCVEQVMWRVRPSVFDDLVAFGASWMSVAWLTAVVACLFLWHYIGTGDYSGARHAKPETTSP